MRCVLLLRAVNLGPTNKLAMKDLAALLEDLGHQEVRTHLNSGNATFTTTSRSVRAVAGEVEAGLRDRLGLGVRACVRKATDLAQALDRLPALEGYVVVMVLFEPPSAGALREVLQTDWSPEVVVGDEQVLYLAYPEGVRSSKLTSARLEKALGVVGTARTPATLRRLL